MRESYPPVVLGHRGASKAFAENTVEAFHGAATLGADWVELDVRIAADGEPVVHHDPTVSVVGSDPLVIAEVPYFALPSWVPTLGAALTACKRPGARSGRPMGVNVEIKSDPHEPDFDSRYPHVPTIVSVIREHLEVDRVLVSSFDPGALSALKALAPDIPTGLLTIDLSEPETVETVLSLAVDGGHRALNPWDGFVTAALVAAAHEHGLAVNVWTVDRPERIAELCGLGVDGIITNVPDICGAVVDAHFPRAR